MIKHPPTSEINKQIFSFFDSFKPMFSHAQWENFVIFILGFLHDSRHKKVTDITELTDNLKDHSVLSKFLGSRSFSIFHIKEKMRHMFMKIYDKSKPVFLYIDDTLIEKAGDKVRADWNYSASKSGFLFSNCIVVALIKNGNIELPFDFKKYFQERYEGDKEYRSKLDLCLMIIRRAVSCFGKEIYVLFDSWYAAAKVINKLKKDGIKFITRLKSNRVILPVKMKLKEYAKTISPRKFKEVRIGDKSYFVYSEKLFINKIGEMHILFCKKKRYGKNVIFLCTNSELSDEKILEEYIHRWEIEQFFSDTKEYLAFEDYQEIRQTSVSRHITVLFSAYFLVSVIRSVIEKCSGFVLTIGQTLKKIRKGISEVKLTLLRRLYQRKLEVKRC
ncbi:MAG: transposase [Candidatus Micrarchaeota archaeon]